MSRIETIGDATLYLGDCRELLPMLEQASALVSDPPYGINYTISARGLQNEGLDALRPWQMQKRAAIKGDDIRFDAAPFLAVPKIALFGANHMPSLPVGGRWICWDKRRDSTPDDHSDCEFIWTNVPGADRIHRQKWRGIVREGEENCSISPKLHPNQKPVALLGRVFDELGIGPGDIVLDPYMGSGSTGVVCARRGLPFIGVESDPEYFDVARWRLTCEAAMASAELFAHGQSPGE